MSSRRRQTWLALLGLVALAAALAIWKPWQRSREPGSGSIEGEPGESLRAGRLANRAPPAAADDAPVATAGEPMRMVPALAVRDEGATSGRFSGRVVNWGSGEGVARAELVFSGPGSAMTIRAGADGSFDFTPPELGSYQLATVSAEGFLPYAPAWGGSGVSLLARPGSRVTGIVFYLTPAIEYSGRVVDADGAPVAAAAIALVSSGRGSFDLMPIKDQFTSGEDGRFVFSAPDNAVLEARHPVAGQGRARVDGAAQISHELVIEIGFARGATAKVSGRVVDGTGSPVSDAHVSASGPRTIATGSGGGISAFVARSDDDGRFELDVPASARYRISAQASGYAMGATVHDVGVPGSRGQVEVVLGATAVIVGRVTSEGGSAVPAFSVVVSRRVGVAESIVATTSVFDADGNFEVRGFAAGPYRVSAAAYGFAPSDPVSATAVMTVAEATPVAITLPLGGTLSGRVSDAESKEPLAMARVVTETSLGGGASAVPIASSVVTDERGHFELSGLPPGKASVLVAAAKHHSQIVGGLAVTSGARLGPIDIELTPTAPGEVPQLELAGIGAALAARDDGMVIEKLIDGGGALEAGLALGDLIVAIDGKSVVELGFQGAIQQIRGPVNTPVSLAVRRGGTGPILELTAMRRKIRA